MNQTGFFFSSEISHSHALDIIRRIARDQHLSFYVIIQDSRSSDKMCAILLKMILLWKWPQFCLYNCLSLSHIPHKFNERLQFYGKALSSDLLGAGHEEIALSTDQLIYQIIPSSFLYSKILTPPFLLQ